MDAGLTASSLFQVRDEILKGGREPETRAPSRRIMVENRWVIYK